ncbi:unconventional myosin IC [Topomyia yanbarensis]|uniref:unconventional myosin IC n=1 Tax=Topomyia yanbarensis TaxID=2498891 RepID=UPI00273CA451|nr:unconventional myosin IC [Topomyia yanbarensis]XP_058826794.1 unconventional myosin IC [Topomyia yanbarensis]XP_058826795.1 unconventional myosin IC [Topomyia yanbarensis]XP_058826796.1 unconventional myosin IC [Topomyia yanbarensis]
MERGLHDRDRVGLQDQVLLENYQSEDAFIDNLKKRFQENLIYTYIGHVLISVNPYKELPIYTEEDIKQYRKRHFFEAPPHVFALSDNAYRSLTEENRGQCILISGESGSGKTEASKKVLQFIAAATGHTNRVEGVKDKLLQSNPVLEAFGNAKTNRNDNSSRFGKYMDVQFDFTGAPEGGNILNYLLEKSRVVHQSTGERNFHIFYQLLAGADDQLLQELHLKRNLDTYYYLTDGENGKDSNIKDSDHYRQVRKAMSVIEIPDQEQKLILEIVASVLHMGNVGFTEEEGRAKILKPESVTAISKLLGCEVEQLRKAFTNRTIEAREDVVTSPLNRDMAIYARDALAKAVYERLFTWLVSRINTSLHSEFIVKKNSVMGILDIYGFEIFKKNSFEQFCINFCNEKLQQLFIELTLKQEQEEYLKEGIEWVPVEYFDNKVICNLIEEKYKGIIALMDEECLRPGDPTDLSFLRKMNDNLGDHAHYICHSRASTTVQKTLGRDEFRLVHYAGDVTYNVQGFLDKNNDLLFRDLKEAMAGCKNDIIKACFPSAEISSKKRPDTAVTQFKNSLNNLMDILMCKEPSYIRCIKPNDYQTHGNFEFELVRHQVKYLGLMENLRVRRAGFAYRRTYERFLQRYKCLSKQTWPHYHGPAKEGVQILACELGYNRDDYRMGQTKIFIRFPKTLFDTEDAFQAKKHYLAAIIQSRWKGRRQRKIYLETYAKIIAGQKYIRRYLAIQERKRRRAAADQIRFFIKGFITRHDEPNECNKSFIEHTKRHWLLKLAKNLPNSFMNHTWIPAPKHCQDASILLRRLHKLFLARVYRLNLSPEKKKQFELKVLSQSKFKDKKKNYPESVGPWFVDDRISKMHATPISNFVVTQMNNEKLHYSTPVIKYDRHGYKPRERFFLLTDQAVYLLDGKTYKQKHRLPLDKIDFCITSERDGIMLIRIPLELKKDKGDLILDVPDIIECCIWIMDVAGNRNIVNLVETGSLSHNLVRGKTGVIEIQTGPQPSITRAKSGNLLVIAGQ